MDSGYNQMIFKNVARKNLSIISILTNGDAPDTGTVLICRISSFSEKPDTITRLNIRLFLFI